MIIILSLTSYKCKGSDHPAFKYLRFVRDLIADRWYDIGLELLEQKDEKAVNIIKKTMLEILLNVVQKCWSCGLPDNPMQPGIN